MPTVSGNVGAVGPPAGSYVPVAAPAGATVDTTTYPDFIRGSGHLTTLVLPSDGGAFAIAISGDAHPRWVFDADPTDYGIVFGDGTVDLANAGMGITYADPDLILQPRSGGSVSAPGATANNKLAQLQQLSPRFLITSGALPTVQLVSGTGAQISTTRDVETYTPLTLTTAGGTVVVALSPDNVTYSTVMTVTPAVNASVTDVTVRVPAAWYLKMTATNATLGLTTYA